MTPRRLFLSSAMTVLITLGIYTWNQRTGTLDSIVLHSGLESGGTVLRLINTLHNRIRDAWSTYIALVDVKEENMRLRTEITALKSRLQATREVDAELIRLRSLMQITAPNDWKALGCRVLGRRIGPVSPLLSLTVNRGYLNGAVPQTPVMTPHGVAGIILRSGPYTSTALLLTDPGVRISVLTQRGRINGILCGAGASKPLELYFIPHNATIEVNEMLITSGLDGVFPKGLPVATVSDIRDSESGTFLTVSANPLCDLNKLEEVAVLVKSGIPEEPPPKASDR